MLLKGAETIELLGANIDSLSPALSQSAPPLGEMKTLKLPYCSVGGVVQAKMATWQK